MKTCTTSFFNNPRWKKQIKFFKSLHFYVSQSIGAAAKVIISLGAALNPLKYFTPLGKNYSLKKYYTISNYCILMIIILLLSNCISAVRFLFQRKVYIGRRWKRSVCRLQWGGKFIVKQLLSKEKLWKLHRIQNEWSCTADVDDWVCVCEYVCCATVLPSSLVTHILLGSIIIWVKLLWMRLLM